MVAGGGRLTVSPGQLVCEAGPLTRRLSGIERIRHKGAEVHVYRALLVPFWFQRRSPS